MVSLQMKWALVKQFNQSLSSHWSRASKVHKRNRIDILIILSLSLSSHLENGQKKSKNGLHLSDFSNSTGQLSIEMLRSNNCAKENSTYFWQHLKHVSLKKVNSCTSSMNISFLTRLRESRIMKASSHRTWDNFIPGIGFCWREHHFRITLRSCGLS